MVYAEVYPKFITDYAERPRDFQRPKRMEEFLHMDGMTMASRSLLFHHFSGGLHADFSQSQLWITSYNPIVSLATWQLCAVQIASSVALC
jgi:hypothetical protein